MARCEFCNGRGFIVASAPISDVVQGATDDAWCNIQRCDECMEFEGDIDDALINLFLEHSQIAAPITIAYTIEGDIHLWCHRSVIARMSHKL